jgi:glycine cleavage system H protein
VQGDIVTIGITQFAADQLTDITYVDLPGVSAEVTGGLPFGEIESVKATGDLYTAVSGEVVDRNEALSDMPGVINSDPYGEGWMIRVKTHDLSPLDSLLDAAAHDAAIADG